MRKGYIILGLLIAMWACKKSGTTTSECAPEKKDYIYESSRQINIDRIILADTAFEHYNYTINSGDKDVFNFTLVFQDCPELADDEGSRIIVFEIPGSLNSFKLKDSADLRNAKALITYACFCIPQGPVLLKVGSIAGERKSNGWHLKASLKPYPASPSTIDFEADFIKK
jgi:hypothetical protein